MGKKKTKKSIIPPRKMIDIGAELYLDMLIEGRMLIQASSGGGKSYMLRVLAENLLPHLPVIILDWEGEFASLREEHDMVLIGSEGETPCRVRTAGLVARGLVEAHMSAIIDLSGLDPRERREYVRDFLVAMIDGLPKKHWPINNERDIVVMVDEAHRLCPQSKKCVSTEAVVNLVCQGRKRGIAGILATQRLSKLDKDAAAECKTSLIGSCSMIDAKTGCDILGLPKSSQHALTQLPTGFWKGIGLAFTMRGVQEFTGAVADTAHGRERRHTFLPARRTKKLGKLFEKLSQIQDKAEQDINDTAEANKVIGVLKREIAKLKKGGAVQTVEKVVPDKAAVEKAVARAMELSAKQRDGVWKPLLSQANKEIDRLLEHIKSMVHLGQKAISMKAITVQAPEGFKKLVRAANKKHPPVAEPMPAEMAAAPSSNGTVTKPQQKILNSVAWWNQIGVNAPSKECVAIMSRYSAKSGGYNNLLGQLRSGGYINYPLPGHICLTHDGTGVAVAPTEHGTLEELHGAWREVLSAPQIKLMDAVIEAHPNGLEKEVLAEGTGYSVTSGGFNNLLGRLRKLGIITKGKIHATPLLFPEALV